MQQNFEDIAVSLRLSDIPLGKNTTNFTPRTPAGISATAGKISVKTNLNVASLKGFNL